MRSSALVVSLCLVCNAVLMLPVLGQDEARLKQDILNAIAKIENYSVGLVRGSVSLRDGPRMETTVCFRGEKYWLERDTLTTVLDEQKPQLIATLEVMGTSNLPFTAAFDGKRFYQFSPTLLTLDVMQAKGVPYLFADSPLLPQQWLKMGGSKRSEFRKFLELTEYETQFEKLTDGRWKLSQKNLGSKLPGGNERVAIRERYIIVDPKCDYLVTEYSGTGFQGTLMGTMEWAKQNGRWYAKQGKQTFGDMPYAEWNIEEISFDASKCRTKFDDMESTVPFATKITFLDENSKALSTSFKGGVDGETEFRLRELAWLKRKKEESK